MANRLNSQLKFLLMKEVDNLAKSPRKLTITSSEFANEMSKELGVSVTVSNIEGCVIAFGMRMSDVFKSQSSSGHGRSIYADIYKLEQRIAALEKKTEGL